jgi:hypothetical protein
MRYWVLLACACGGKVTDSKDAEIGPPVHDAASVTAPADACPSLCGLGRFVDRALGKECVSSVALEIELASDDTAVLEGIERDIGITCVRSGCGRATCVAETRMTTLCATSGPSWSALAARAEVACVIIRPI